MPNEDIGKNDFFYASAACVEAGGFLPTAAQLIGAAVAREARLDDRRRPGQLLARRRRFGWPEGPPRDVRDARHHPGRLDPPPARRASPRARAATPRPGEPDPVPLPANPAPQSLQYVTVYDNHDKGGFAGSKPVSAPETFRCGFIKAQGQSATEEG